MRRFLFTGVAIHVTSATRIFDWVSTTASTGADNAALQKEVEQLKAQLAVQQKQNSTSTANSTQYIARYTRLD